MTSVWDEPNEQNHYLEPHAGRLLYSFTRWTGRTLIEDDLPMAEKARRLFYAPFVVLSHDATPDPIFNYANKAGLTLFELNWEELIKLPSRCSAEPTHQAERERLLAAVARQGYIDDYRGIRVAKSGRKFLIEQATVWNLLDEKGAPYGQAAMFSHWRFLE
ncbi:MAG: MEKHLA domain-containing protein [Deltaproteobacteria bacterium]|nr:MEKHLA domain-containing protein [Deltaproteobacteria bacterium]